MAEPPTETIDRTPLATASEPVPSKGLAQLSRPVSPRREFPHTRIRRTLGLIAALAVAAIVGDMVWEREIRDRIIAKHWATVVPGKLYRSGQISPTLIEGMLTRHGIRTIINLQGESLDDEKQRAEHEVAITRGIEEVRCPLGGDGTGDIRSYAVALREIRSCLADEKPVLVHCAAGAQRTGGVIAAYRMLLENASPQGAYAEMKAHGWKPVKDQILIDYLNAHMAELSRLLVEMQVLDHVPDPLPVLGP